MNAKVPSRKKLDKMAHEITQLVACNIRGCPQPTIKKAPKPKSMDYDVSIWLDDNNEVCGANFHTKKEALDYAKRNLKKNPTAVADFKHWNDQHDDYDYTYYRLKDGELTEVQDF